MSGKNDDFLKRLLQTFEIEAKDHISAISSGLIELEKASAFEKQPEIIETIFRDAHSLKGAARAVNATQIEAVCKPLETLLAAIKRKELELTSELLDVLHQAVDGISQLLLSLDATETADERKQTAALIRKLDMALQPQSVQEQAQEFKQANSLIVIKPAEVIDQSDAMPSAVRPAEAISPPHLVSEGRSILSETVRIAAVKLNSLLLQSEELLSSKQAIGQRTAEVQEIKASLIGWKKRWAEIEPEIRKIEQSLGQIQEGNRERSKKSSKAEKVLEFLDWNNDFIKPLQLKVSALERALAQDHRAIAAMVDKLLEDVKQASMMPFSSLLEILPKLVRNLSHDQGKQIDLVISGAEIEIDRRVLEAMKDPLIHLARNAIDHGIEKPDERARKGKPRRGAMRVTISQKDSSKVELLVSDDGRGIDAERVRASALEAGLVLPEEIGAFDQESSLNLVFQSGITTSPLLTDLSGRGLGLAIVREKVEKLGGSVSLETRLESSTTFRIILPLTLATFRGLLVRLRERFFFLPSASVERAVRIKKEDIRTVENRETIQLDGQVISLARLDDALELPAKMSPDDTPDCLQAVILSSAEKRIAFLVDEILLEQEVLVKKLGKQLARVRNVSGATVLGNGKVVPILNAPDLLKSAVRSAGATRTAAIETAGAKRKSVLIAEDSITSRMLLKNILETAGYDVKTSVDGIDALTQLRTGSFDVVISDVEMPRMNGFDLTAKIRGDKKLAELPVVLVTALDSREDRERGIEVGANAYIVKSRFDQSNLLEAIQRLI